MGASATKARRDDRPVATLFYASYTPCTIWQEFAERAEDEEAAPVRHQLCDVARAPERALAEGVASFPAVVCVDPWTEDRAIFYGADTLLTDLDAWAAARGAAP